MKMLCMVFVVLLSVTVLSKRYSMIQYISVGVIICGLTIVTMMDLNSA